MPTNDAVVLVELGGRRMALDAQHVTEVAVLSTLTPVPLAPAEILGVTQLRGQILPVLDALGEGLSKGRLSDALVVIEHRGLRAALIVDQVVGVEASAGDVPRVALEAIIERALTR